MNGKEKKSKNNQQKDDVEESDLMAKWKQIQKESEKNKHKEKENKKCSDSETKFTTEKVKKHLKVTNMPVSEKRPRVNMNEELSEPPEIYQYDSVFQEHNDNAQQKLNALHEEHKILSDNKRQYIGSNWNVAIANESIISRRKSTNIRAKKNSITSR